MYVKHPNETAKLGKTPVNQPDSRLLTGRLLVRVQLGELFLCLAVDVRPAGTPSSSIQISRDPADVSASDGAVVALLVAKPIRLPT